MRNVFILFIITLIFVQYSCKKETVIKNVPITHSWMLDSSMYGYDKILLTSVPLNDTILAVANGTSIWYIYTNHLNYTFSIPVGYKSYLTTGLIPPSMTKNITVATTDPNNLIIFRTYMPVFQSGIPVTFSPTYSQSANSLKGFPSSTLLNSGFPIINSKYILAPYEIDFHAEKATFSLIKIDTSQTFSIVSTKDIIIDNTIKPYFYSGTYYSWTFYNKFFVTYYGQSFRIDTMGNVKNILNDTAVFNGKYIEQMFTVNNSLFALGWGTLFVSNDQGETWNIFSNLSGTNWGWLQYYNVGKETYATYLSQLAKVTLVGNTLNVQELDNDGLETNQITSINKCGKYVFITTLSGLFYRDTSSLNTFKK